jgi:large subunit ribosomal protein L5
MTRLLDKYRQEVRQAMKQQFGYRNEMQIPVIQKVTVSMGIGKAVENKARVEAAVADLTAITGQKPVITRAKKSISQFRLRQNMPIGCKVTLRGQRMFEFLDRFITIVVPRFRDFRGLPSKMDGRGSYSVGLSEQSRSCFPRSTSTRCSSSRA